jgi:hypothetical protein
MAQRIQQRLAALAALTFALAFIMIAGNITPALAGQPPVIKAFEVGVKENGPEIHATRAAFSGSIQAYEAETQWRVEYSPSENGPWTTGTSGTMIKTSEDYPLPIGSREGAQIRGLAPETKYFARLAAENEFGHATSQTVHFTTTGVGAPEILEPENCGESDVFGTRSSGEVEGVNFLFCGSVFTASAEGRAHIESDGAKTEYNIEYSSSASGPWAPVASGANGSIDAAQEWSEPQIQLTGLEPETPYYVRVTASNSKGSESDIGSFETAPVRPKAGTLSVTVTAATARLEGHVYSGTYETNWRFEYATSENGPWTMVPDGSGTISAGEKEQAVVADLTGLSQSTTYYVRLVAESVKGTSTSPPSPFGTGGLPGVQTLAVHAIHGEAMRILGAVTPNGYDTHYHFQYIPEEQFEPQSGEGGFVKAQSTPEHDAGAGSEHQSTIYVGEDIPGLESGKMYDFRLVAISAGSGGPVAVDGETQTLSVPAAPEPSGEAGVPACPNESLRTGLSAHLPDCRAYEQITPVEKEGAFEPFNAIGYATQEPLFSEDGDHFMIDAEDTNWGSGQGPYFFSRASDGWQMTAAAPQPETGVDNYQPDLTNPEFTSLALTADFFIAGGLDSPDTELKVGPVGGPYTTVASIPKSVDPHPEWAAVSEDFGKLILSTTDRTLVPGHPSDTTEGQDLYEFSEGQFRQLNVLTSGATIGSCGATLVQEEGRKGELVASRHAVSPDGSRVFFEAVPGGDCSEPKHLYMRVNGAETVDIGEYLFLTDSRSGSQLFLEQGSGTAGNEALFYDTASKVLTPLLTVDLKGSTQLSPHFEISEDFSTIYFTSGESLPNTGAPPGGGIYLYDVATGTLRFVLAGNTGSGGAGSVQELESTISSEGRYYYFEAREVMGVPGGGLDAGLPAAYHDRDSEQLYRYDSVENTVECVSCSSAFDPEPKLSAENGGGTSNISPVAPVVSADGDYAFFDTAAALVPQDVDGEVPEPVGTNEKIEEGLSPSWDIYEWRKPGIDGCALVQGCLSLITPGTDGVLVALIGTTPSGGDVFFTTHSSLVPQDKDTAGDVYDARIGGGFALPPRSLECEGDTCSTPANAPNDETPSSSTFMGPGNLLTQSIPSAPAKAKPAVKRRVRKCAKRKKCPKLKGKRATRPKVNSRKEGKRS